MTLVARLRFEVARRPWIRWLVVIAIAIGAGHIARTAMVDLDRERRQWGDSRVVMVADVAHLPGDRIHAHRVELPLAALPDGAVDELPDLAVAKRHLTEGAVVVASDLTGTTGPASAADDGSGVVAIGVADSAPQAGARVQVVAEGVVLADAATVVAVSDLTVYVAVPLAAAPIVAEAAHRSTAALVYLP